MSRAHQSPEQIKAVRDANKNWMRKHRKKKDNSSDAATIKTATTPASVLVNTEKQGVGGEINADCTKHRVRASERSCSNPSEKKGANFISGYSNAQRAAINQLETLNLAESKAEVYKSHLREYPTWTTGVRKCHLRALYNVNQEAAQAAVDQQLHWKDNRGVHDLLAQYGDANEGRVFRIWNQHWVALKGENRGTKVAMYFDDKIYMKIRNFDGASKALELMELMKEKDWIKSHQGLNHKATSSQLSKKFGVAGVI